MRLVNLLHQGDNVVCAKLDQLVKCWHHVLIRRANEWLLEHATFLQDIVKSLTLVVCLASTIENTEEDERVGVNFTPFGLKDARSDKFVDP